jgi:hypothetical protein
MQDVARHGSETIDVVQLVGNTLAEALTRSTTRERQPNDWHFTE